MNAQRAIAGILALSGLSATALYAAQPPNPSSVQSDAFYNTAIGPAALSHVQTPPAKPCVPFAFNSSSHYMSGCANTASGFGALDLNTTGAANTATGAGALLANTSGAYNTAIGTLALFSTTTGDLNTALGVSALFSNTSGYYNLASGAYSLFNNRNGANNTASGYYALFDNVAGNANTAVGSFSLAFNSSGAKNTAAGAYTLYSNVGGNGNVALGSYALYNNLNGGSSTSSSYNVAIGMNALYANTTNAAAGYNSAVGYSALSANTGIGNSALGANAGSGLTTGNYNTDIGYGVTGVAGDNYVTRIGVTITDNSIPGTPTTYIAGIYNTVLSGQAVVVTSSGQLGVSSASSERFKTDIATMDADTDRLAQLRPVTFRFRSDAQGTRQYGLIAEEVARVYPELVIRDEHGRIDGVRYDELAPMLLNEVQKQRATIRSQDARIDEMTRQLAELDSLRDEMRAALAQVKARDDLVAGR